MEWRGYPRTLILRWFWLWGLSDSWFYIILYIYTLDGLKCFAAAIGSEHIFRWTYRPSNWGTEEKFETTADETTLTHSFRWDFGRFAWINQCDLWQAPSIAIRLGRTWNAAEAKVRGNVAQRHISNSWSIHDFRRCSQKTQKISCVAPTLV